MKFKIWILIAAIANIALFYAGKYVLKIEDSLILYHGMRAIIGVYCLFISGLLIYIVVKQD
jgi:hypothetical protein